MHRHCCRVSAPSPSFGALAEFGRSCQVWALLPETAMESTLYIGLSLGAPAEFRRSRQKEKESSVVNLVMTFIYMHIYVYWFVTLKVLCSVWGSDTKIRLSRNGFRPIWGGVLRHISTSLAITEWGLGVYSWFMTSCEAFRGRNEFGVGCRRLDFKTPGLNGPFRSGFKTPGFNGPCSLGF